MFSEAILRAPRERSEETTGDPAGGDEEGEEAGLVRGRASAPRFRGSPAGLRTRPEPLPFSALSSCDERSAANTPWPSDRAEAREPVDERFDHRGVLICCDDVAVVFKPAR